MQEISLFQEIPESKLPRPALRLSGYEEPKRKKTQPDYSQFSLPGFGPKWGENVPRKGKIRKTPQEQTNLTFNASQQPTPKEGIYIVGGFQRKTITAEAATRYLPGFTVTEILEMGGIQKINAEDHGLDQRYTWLDEIDVINRGRERIWFRMATAEKPTQDEYFRMINF